MGGTPILGLSDSHFFRGGTLKSLNSRVKQFFFVENQGSHKLIQPRNLSKSVFVLQIWGCVPYKKKSPVLKTGATQAWSPPHPKMFFDHNFYGGVGDALNPDHRGRRTPPQSIGAPLSILVLESRASPYTLYPTMFQSSAFKCFPIWEI